MKNRLRLATISIILAILASCHQIKTERPNRYELPDKNKFLHYYQDPRGFIAIYVKHPLDIDLKLRKYCSPREMELYQLKVMVELSQKYRKPYRKIPADQKISKTCEDAINESASYNKASIVPQNNTIYPEKDPNNTEQDLRNKLKPGKHNPQLPPLIIKT